MKKEHTVIFLKLKIVAIYQLLTAAFISISLNSYSQNNLVRIDGQFLNYDGINKIYYSLSPTQGVVADLEIQPDSLGRFTIIKSIDKTHYFFITYRNNELTHMCRLIVQPGTNYSFISDGYKTDEWDTKYSPYIYSWKMLSNDVSTSSKLDMGQIFYNKIDDATSGSLYHDEWDLNNPENLIDSLQSKINTQLEVLQRLKDENKIDAEQFNIIKLNIEYVNAYRLQETICDTWQLPDKFGIDDSSTQSKLNNVYSEVFDLYPVEGVPMEDFFGFDRYVNLYLLYLNDSQDGEFKPVRRKGVSIISELIKNADQVLSPDALKAYKFNNTMNYTYGLGVNSAQLATSFLVDNPDLKETYAGKFLEDELIPRASEFEKLKEKELSEDIFILDQNAPITSYSQLLDSLKGKPFIIDFWATWCMPCRYQFNYNKTLKSFLKKHGINIVYIALEYDLSDEQREQWKNYIKAYDLTGYHLIAYNELKKSIEQSLGKIGGVPRYMIVDKNGVILEADAYKPSEGEKLIQQIKEKLHL